MFWESWKAGTLPGNRFDLRSFWRFIPLNIMFNTKLNTRRANIYEKFFENTDSLALVFEQIELFVAVVCNYEGFSFN